MSPFCRGASSPASPGLGENQSFRQKARRIALAHGAQSPLPLEGGGLEQRKHVAGTLLPFHSSPALGDPQRFYHRRATAQRPVKTIQGSNGGRERSTTSIVVSFVIIDLSLPND